MLLLPISVNAYVKEFWYELSHIVVHNLEEWHKNVGNDKTVLLCDTVHQTFRWKTAATGQPPEGCLVDRIS